MRTLVFAGFVPETVERHPGFALLHMTRFDEFGARHRYAFALADERALAEAEIGSARIIAEDRGEQLVVIGSARADVTAVPWERFANLFGGPVSATSALEPGFTEALRTLGRNELPPGLVGQPDDLFEEYVRAAFEFIFAGRVIRYGQERRFEKRSDGIALPNDRFRALYDAKAYEHGYPVTADSVRQFASYIEEFKQRYEPYIPRQHAFIVVSATFAQGEAALRNRSTELLAQCGVPLACLTAEVLGEIIRMVSAEPAARRAINWPLVFSRAVVDAKMVSTEIEAIRNDGVARRA